jgi:hypothetical protein
VGLVALFPANLGTGIVGRARRQVIYKLGLNLINSPLRAAPNRKKVEQRWEQNVIDYHSPPHVVDFGGGPMLEGLVDMVQEEFVHVA